MKLTVILDAKGEVTGFAPGSARGPLAGFGKDAPLGGLMAGPGQTLKEIEVADELVNFAEFHKLQEHIKQHIKR